MATRTEPVIDFSRRRLLAGFAAGFVAQPALGQSEASDPRKRLSQALQSGKVNGLHALLVAQGGSLLLEHYGRGEDEAWHSCCALKMVCLHGRRSQSLVSRIHAGIELSGAGGFEAPFERPQVLPSRL